MKMLGMAVEALHHQGSLPPHPGWQRLVATEDCFPIMDNLRLEGEMIQRILSMNNEVMASFVSNLVKLKIKLMQQDPPPQKTQHRWLSPSTIGTPSWRPTPIAMAATDDSISERDMVGELQSSFIGPKSSMINPGGRGPEDDLKSALTSLTDAISQQTPSTHTSHQHACSPTLDHRACSPTLDQRAWRNVWDEAPLSSSDSRLTSNKTVSRWSRGDDNQVTQVTQDQDQDDNQVTQVTQVTQDQDQDQDGLVAPTLNSKIHSIPQREDALPNSHLVSHVVASTGIQPGWRQLAAPEAILIRVINLHTPKP